MWRDAARLISIHALLAESDEPETAYTDSAKTISIHALLAESDQLGAVISTLVAGFLSTLSLRRATWGSKPQQPWHCNFYPRSPCGERPPTLQTDAPRLIISIHALLAESDVYNFVQQITLHYFYPRSPCGERHSLSFRRGGIERYFYPRSPCGERPGTLSAPCENCQISIHALLAESDCVHFFMLPSISRFLSTLSLRRATPLCPLLWQWP